MANLKVNDLINEDTLKKAFEFYDEVILEIAYLESNRKNWY